MAHHEARMSSKGQVTIPAPVRQFFGLMAGDIVDFYVDEQTRCVRMRARNRSLESLFGALNKYVGPGGKPVTQGDIDQAIGDHVAEDDDRIMRQYAEWREFQEWKRTKRSAAE